MPNNFLSQLEWRFAAKGFDTEKKIPEDDIQKILKSVHLSPSSFGLQPYHIHVVSDRGLLKTIKELAWGQPQVEECSHLLIFSGRNDISEKRIDAYCSLASGKDAERRKEMKGYEDMMKGAFQGKSSAEVMEWGKRQAYIALGFALAAAAELGIDCCPMEGFDPKRLDVLLELPEYLNSVALLPLGYRKNDPERPKIRFPESDLFTSVV